MQGHILFNFQESGGTVQVDSLDAIPFTDESLTLNLEPIEESNNYGRFVQSPTHKGAALCEGELTVEAEPVALGHMLRTFFDNYELTAVDSLHIFKSNIADFDGKYAGTPLTIEAYRDVGQAFLYYDLQGTTLELGISNGELMNATAGFVGGGYGKQANSTPTFPSNKPFKWDQVSAQIDSASVIDITELTISHDRAIDPKYTLITSNNPTKFKRDGFEKVEFSGTMIFQSHSYQLAFETYDTHSFKLSMLTESADLLIDAPAFRFTEFTPTMDGQSIVEASFSGICEYKADSATAIQYTLNCTRADSYGNAN